MRATLRVLLAASLLIFPGCLTDPNAPGQASGDAPESDAIVGYRAYPSNERATNATVFAFRGDGSADRLLVFRDGSATLRAGPGIEYAPKDLAALAPAAPGNRSAGGLVFRVELGRVPEAEAAALRAALAAPWPSPPWDDSPHADEYARIHDGGAADVARAPADAPALAALAAAFEAAEQAFLVESVSTIREPADARPPECVEVEATISPAAFMPGEHAVVTVTAANCDDEPVTLGQSPCDDAPLLHVDVLVRSGGARGPRTLGPGEGPSAAFALDFACRGEPAPVTIAPGANATFTRRWNGTFGECDAAGACAFAPAPGGQHTVLAYASYQQYPANAWVTVIDPEAPRVPFLLVKEYDWANATAGGTILGNFGPHCAPASYTLDPTTLTLRYSGDALPAPEGVVVRDFRDSPRSEGVVTMSADRVELHEMEGDEPARLRSPFEPDATIALVERDGADFIVDGTRVAPGETHRIRVERDAESDGKRFHTTMVLHFENLGDAPTLYERAGGCM